MKLSKKSFEVGCIVGFIRQIIEQKKPSTLTHDEIRKFCEDESVNFLQKAVVIDKDAI